MSTPSKFSLILLHDDGRTIRMRMTRGMYRILIGSFVILPLLGLIGLWTGYEGWRSLRAWQGEKTAFQTRIDALRVQVERLSALEALIDPKSAARSGSASAVAAAARPADAPDAAGTDPVRPAPARPDVAPPAQPAAPAQEPSGNKAPVVAAEKAPEQREAINTGIIRVENLRAALIDPQRIRAGADLYAANANGRQLVGKVVFSLLTADGRQFPLVNEDAAFRISRFKKVTTLSPLPLPVADLDNASVVVEVRVGDKLVYRSFCPVEELPGQPS